MVALIKEGLAPNKRVHNNYCRSCGTHFSFIEEEAGEVQGWGKHELVTVQCPLSSCGKPQYIYLINDVNQKAGMGTR